MAQTDKNAMPKHLQVVRANLPLLKRLDDDSYARHGRYKFCIDPDCPDDEFSEETVDRLARICWGCGWELDDGYLERCHVIPDRAGGSTGPANFFLLCDYCHAEQPDASRQVQERWLLEREYKWARIARETREMEAALHSVPGSTEERLLFFLGRLMRPRPAGSSDTLFQRFLSRTRSYKPAKAQQQRLGLLPKMYTKFLRAVARYETRKPHPLSGPSFSVISLNQIITQNT